MNNNKTIALKEKDVEAIINGETIQKDFEGKTINIRQSYSKDIAMSVIDRDKKIFSKGEISNMKAAFGNMTLNNSIKISR